MTRSEFALVSRAAVATLLLLCAGCPYPSTIVVGDDSGADVALDGTNESGMMDMPSTACMPGTVDCDGDQMNGCEVTLATDPRNCGTCRNACTDRSNSLAICASGMCDIRCVPGFENCDGMASNGCEVETGSSPTNCGSCGRRCTGNQVCTEGMCACPAGTMTCAGNCVDTRTDRSNCGACGMVCNVGQFCSLGMCTTGCSPPTMNCANVCFNTQTDPMHCGNCTTACSRNQTCMNSMCQCVMPYTACAGQCVSTAGDAANCGRCGNACPRGASCERGFCRCAPGYTLCGAACVNLQIDLSNCGACGTRCGIAQICSAGTCRASVILMGS